MHKLFTLILFSFVLSTYGQSLENKLFVLESDYITETTLNVLNQNTLNPIPYQNLSGDVVSKFSNQHDYFKLFLIDRSRGLIHLNPVSFSSPGVTLDLSRFDAQNCNPNDVLLINNTLYITLLGKADCSTPGLLRIKNAITNNNEINLNSDHDIRNFTEDLELDNNPDLAKILFQDGSHNLNNTENQYLYIQAINNQEDGYSQYPQINSKILKINIESNDTEVLELNGFNPFSKMYLTDKGLLYSLTGSWSDTTASDSQVYLLDIDVNSNTYGQSKVVLSREQMPSEDDRILELAYNKDNKLFAVITANAKVLASQTVLSPYNSNLDNIFASINVAETGQANLPSYSLSDIEFTNESLFISTTAMTNSYPLGHITHYTPIFNTNNSFVSAYSQDRKIDVNNYPPVKLTFIDNADSVVSTKEVAQTKPNKKKQIQVGIFPNPIDLKNNNHFTISVKNGAANDSCKAYVVDSYIRGLVRNSVKSFKLNAFGTKKGIQFSTSILNPKKIGSYYAYVQCDSSKSRNTTQFIIIK